MKRFSTIVSALLVLAGCEEYPDSKSLSGGDIDEVIIIVDEDRKESRLANALLEAFREPYLVINQNEPRYSARIKSYDQFVNAGELLNKYRTLVFCGTLDRNTALTKLIRERAGDEVDANVQSDSSYLFITANNVYAKPQLVVYAFASNEQELIDRWNTHSEQMLAAIRRSENARLHEMIYSDGVDQNISSLIEDRYNVSIDVPNFYLPIEDTAELLWLQREELERNRDNQVSKDIKHNIVIHPFRFTEEELSAMRDDSLHWPVAHHFPFVLRDSLGKWYVRGTARNVPLMIERKYAPVIQREFEFKGHTVVESRGLWNMRIMGGPFINWYVFLDEANAVMIDCFLLAPGSEKRPLMRQLEVILETMRFETT